MKNLTISVVLSLLITYVKADCWATQKGFPCCTDKNTSVFYTDEDGNWGIENGQWCGIENDGVVRLGECWSLSKGIPCCTGDNPVVDTEDSDGKWAIENGNWCGIAVEQEIDKVNPSWAAPYGIYTCKYNYITPNYYDQEGDWYRFADGAWCAYKNSVAKWNDRSKFEETRTQWENFKSKWGKEIDTNNFERLSVFAGEDESQLNFGWYSKDKNYSLIRFGTSKNL
eukprot:jgi/Orpsp1_1/1186041/evm.model.c7180000096599.1